MIKKVRSLIGVNRLASLDIKDMFVSCKNHSSKRSVNHFARNFWLALSLQKARKKNTSDFDKEKLRCSINRLRSLTRLEPDEFYPIICQIFSDCGVSFVFLPYLKHSDLYGATKWFDKNSVMLAISNRGGKADLFWFTLFHELAHVFQEHHREVLLSTNEEEKEADRMAQDILINQNKWDLFVSRKDFTSQSICSFADSLEILPDIVLGRLHKEKYLPYNINYSSELNKQYIFNLQFDS
jgi:hypothetical protein